MPTLINEKEGDKSTKNQGKSQKYKMPPETAKQQMLKDLFIASKHAAKIQKTTHKSMTIEEQRMDMNKEVEELLTRKQENQQKQQQ